MMVEIQFDLRATFFLVAFRISRYVCVTQKGGEKKNVIGALYLSVFVYALFF
jgi:hypothetical protein